MKVLLQDKFSGLFYRSPGEWTPHPEEARSFQTSWQALRYCRDHELPETRVVLKFEDGRYDLAVGDCS